MKKKKQTEILEELFSLFKEEPRIIRPVKYLLSKKKTIMGQECYIFTTDELTEFFGILLEQMGK
jgi:hypothetical protein